VRGTRTSTTSCDCRRNVAYIAFRLGRRSDVGVDVVSSTGATVASLLRPREMTARIVQIARNGTRSHSGGYCPTVLAPQLHRTQQLPAILVAV